MLPAKHIVAGVNGYIQPKCACTSLQESTYFAYSNSLVCTTLGQKSIIIECSFVKLMSRS